MSRRIVLLTLALTLLVVIAFLVPLLALVRDVAASRETIEATVEAQSAAALVNVDQGALVVTLERLNTGSARRTTVFQATGPVLGEPAQRDATVDAVTLSRTATTYEVAGGRAVLVPVLGTDQRTSAVVRTFVPDAELTAGVGRASLALVVLGLVLLAAAAGLVRLLGRSLVRPLLSVAGTADALRGGDQSARAVPAEPAEVRRIAEALNRSRRPDRRAAAGRAGRRGGPVAPAADPADRAPAGRGGSAGPGGGGAGARHGRLPGADGHPRHRHRPATGPGGRGGGGRGGGGAGAGRLLVGAGRGAGAARRGRAAVRAGARAGGRGRPGRRGGRPARQRVRAHAGRDRVLRRRTDRAGARRGGHRRRPRDRRPGAARAGPVRRVLDRPGAGHRSPHRRGGRRPARPHRRPPHRPARRRLARPHPPA